LGDDDKTIQAILWHSNVSITMNIGAKSGAELQVSAMNALSAEMQGGPTCDDLAKDRKGLVNEVR
jgi:hypothetical protein